MAESKALLKETIAEAKIIVAEKFGVEQSNLLLECADYIGNRKK